ncbi:MAG: hypothetical protein GF364_08905, partial [Candidatus Lokiarchaeota archaeon]|nr:hypothetical protein [Candidatus Lokiarchaeota archaeon]
INLISTYDLGFNMTAVKIRGQKAFIGTESNGLIISNINNTDFINLIASISSISNINQLEIDGNFLYVLNDTGIISVNITDIYNPFMIDYLSLSGNPRNIIIKNRFAYIACGEAGINIVNVSDATKIDNIGSINGIGNVLDLTLTNDAIYGAVDTSGFIALNISNKIIPEYVYTENTNGSACGIRYNGGYVYIADLDAGLSIYKLENAQNALPINDNSDLSLTEEFNCINIEMNDNYCYILDEKYGFVIIRVKDPMLPDKLIDYTSELEVKANDLIVRDDLVFIADDNSGLKIFKCNECEGIEYLGGTLLDQKPASIGLDGNIAYMTDYSGRLYSINISDPTNPVNITSVLFGGLSYDITIDGDLVFVADGANGLAVIEASDPNNLNVLTHTGAVNMALNTYIDGDIAYLSCYDDGLHFYNVSNPNHPSILNIVDFLGYSVHNVIVQNKLAYIAWGSRGLNIFNIHDMSNIIQIGSHAISGDEFALDLENSGDIVYIAGSVSGLEVFDVSNPSNPQRTFNDDTYVFDTVEIDGDLLYASGSVLSIETIVLYKIKQSGDDDLDGDGFNYINEIWDSGTDPFDGESAPGKTQNGDNNPFHFILDFWWLFIVVLIAITVIYIYKFYKTGKSKKKKKNKEDPNV